MNGLINCTVAEFQTFWKWKLQTEDEEIILQYIRQYTADELNLIYERTWTPQRMRL
jgi:hypothetical protein